ncbi:hypothetical protein ERJ75_001446600 [Trypanosoma vivax]|nr:hypothetical protein TRVL_04846 [Trypanosoma vivax]KAH8606925.1 hypothetical protein ERJ75_001446600 [Trypanosoma vivax]
MNPDAQPFVPTFARRRVYSRAEMRRLEPLALEAIRCAPVASSPSSPRLPADFAALLARLPYADEILNVEHVASLMRDGPPSCSVCLHGPEPCNVVRETVAGVVRRAASSRLSAVLLQSGDVVQGLLQLALVFEARQSSLRLRMLAESHPMVVNRVRDFLCGEGYHLPLPKVTEHSQWQTLNSLLKFDWIRDNRTRIFTEISKKWKKRRTQFEQFVHFYEYRDARPVRRVKNMLTHCTKPVLVSLLSGDIFAVVILARLGFFVPPDYYWDIFPFFRETLLRKDRDGRLYSTMRHLCLHLAERQRAIRGDVYNPIEPPRTK